MRHKLTAWYDLFCVPKNMSSQTSLPRREFHKSLITKFTQLGKFYRVQGTTDEEEIEKNLAHVSVYLNDLKSVALDMNVEVHHQNEQIDRIIWKVYLNKHMYIFWLIF